MTVYDVEPLLPVYDNIRAKTIEFIEKAQTPVGRILRAGLVLGIAYIPLWATIGFLLYSVINYLIAMPLVSFVITSAIVGLLWISLTDRTVTKLDLPNAMTALTVTLALAVIYIVNAFLSALGITAVIHSLLVSHGASLISNFIMATYSASTATIAGGGAKAVLSLGALTGIFPVIFTKYMGNLLQGIFFLIKQGK